MKYNGNSNDFRIFNNPKQKKVVRKNQINLRQRATCGSSLIDEESVIKTIQRLSLDPTRALLADCIKLVQRQNQELRGKYLQEERNARILKKLQRKLKRHKSDSLLLKNYFNGLKRAMNHQEWGQVTTSDKRPMLESQLTFIQVLAEDNLKDTSQCLGVIEYMMSNSLGKKEDPKSLTFEEAMAQFFESLKTHTKRDQKSYINQAEEETLTKGPKGELSYKKPRENNEGKLLPNDENPQNNKEVNKPSVKEIAGYSELFKSLVKAISQKSQMNKYVLVETQQKELNQVSSGPPEHGVLASQNLIGSTEKNAAKEVDLKKIIQKSTKTTTFKNEKKQKIAISKNQFPKVKNPNRTLIHSSIKSFKTRDAENRSLGNEESKSNRQETKIKVISKINEFHNPFKNEKLSSGTFGAKEHLRYEKVKSLNQILNPTEETESLSSYRSFISVKPVQKHHDSHRKDHKDYINGSLKSIPLEESKRSLPLTKISSQMTMEKAATAIINRLYEQNPNTQKGSVKRLDTKGMATNSFLGKLPALRASERVDKVWTDLMEKHRQWTDNALNPEDDQRVRHILKERYLDNVQRLLRDRVKQIRIGNQRGSVRSEAKSESVKAKREKPKKKTKPKDTDELQSWEPRRMHKQFLRKEIDMLSTNIATLDLERMGHMIRGREVPTEDKDLELLQTYEKDPQHYNILILSLDKELSDTEYEEQIPVLQRNYEYIRQQLEVNARRKRILEMSAKHQDQPGDSDLSAESFHYIGIDFNADYLAQRRAIWAEFIATQPLTPTEAFLAEVRRQKREADKAKRAEERRQELKHKREIQKTRRSLSALFRTPRQTHRLRQAIQEMQDELEGKATSSPSLTRRCSRCGLACSQRSCETLDSLREILAQFRS